MSSEIIKKQLKQVYYADLSNFDPETNTYTIPKYSKPRYEIGKCYLINLNPILVGNTWSVFATNWNNSTCPLTPYVKAAVSKINGKMLYVDTLAYDFENRQDLTIMWSGWLPEDEIIQICELT